MHARFSVEVNQWARPAIFREREIEEFGRRGAGRGGGGGERPGRNIFGKFSEGRRPTSPFQNVRAERKPYG
jgi:hypothetical protein